MTVCTARQQQMKPTKENKHNKSVLIISFHYDRVLLDETVELFLYGAFKFVELIFVMQGYS